MKPHEEIIIQRYVDKCIVFYGASLFVFYGFLFATVTLIPPLMHQPFPSLAEYPFDVFYQPVKTIIFASQAIAGLMLTGQLCMNVFMALLIWFASARFEILSEELRKVTKTYHLFECIKKHQELLKYANDVSIVARPFALTTVCCSTVSLITILLFLLKDQSIVGIAWVCLFSSAALSEVFMYTWPAEHLIHSTNEIGHVAFEMLKKYYLINVWKCLQIIIIRSQKPITITIPCLMPALSFNYFAAYLSTILSYFTTLRVMMIEDAD
ncbi:hypothetical protein PUN28_016906 [Cardiocondyla obscurior]|uniref:Uncharacterized protein n=1 Tax=Cardiocondyla obscurior TaxID=286306 RepID=A0AAW2ESY6_9HYME